MPPEVQASVKSLLYQVAQIKPALYHLFFPSAINAWNSLPSEVQTLSKNTSFKRAVALRVQGALSIAHSLDKHSPGRLPESSNSLLTVDTSTLKMGIL